MGRIIVLAHNLAVDSDAVQYAAKIASAAHYDVVCLALVTSYASTAELIHSQSEATMGELRSLRAHQTTADWVQTLEKLRTTQWREAERQKHELKEYFGKRGVAFSCHILPFEASVLFQALKENAPVDLLVASRLRFPKDLTSQGIMTLGDLGTHFSCPAIDVHIMQRFLDRPPWQLRVELAAYGGGAVVAGLWYWRHADAVNQFLMSGGMAPAAAIMAAAALVAWGFGKAVQSLLRVAKLDIY